MRLRIRNRKVRKAIELPQGGFFVGGRCWFLYVDLDVDYNKKQTKHVLISHKCVDEERGGKLTYVYVFRYVYG